jgi:methylase of polypeptide subunit release factors
MEKATTDLIIKYLAKVKSANKELTKKEHFKDLLNRLYAEDKEIIAIVDALSKGAETTILNIPRKDKIHKGSADTLYNNVIIEFENDLTKTLTHAKEQLAGYLLGQFKSGLGYNYTLIASDFINWKVFSPSIESIQKLDSLNEHELQLEEIATASFTLTEKNADDFYYYIDRFLFKEEKRKATLKHIEEAFGYQSNIFIESFRELKSHFNEAKKYGEVQVSYEQWKRFLSIAYGSFDASENNFLIHTYLSVFSKMLAYSVVSNDDYISDDEMKGILDGTVFHKYNIQNFIDNDFFHWVKSDRNFKNLKKAFRIIAQEISTFDFEDVEEDVLKGVYQELIDLDTRHALGEYYTPDWLCERVVQEFDFKSNQKILDPSCGSGSFLRAIIHRIKKQNPKISIEEISNQVYGIDIHPLSVQIAKTTLLLALGKDIRKSKKPIHLNIILANTLLAPEGVQNLFGGDFLMYIDKEKFYLNTKILEDVEFFDEALEVCETLAEQTLHKKNETEEVFHNILTKRAKGLTKSESSSYYKIYEGLKKVKEAGRDSIWKFIVQNLYKPYFLANKFDYIIGNPPWFTYSSIKNEEYQDILNKLAIKYEVKPKRTANFPHLEIAAIFYAYCSSYFLKQNGEIAFVLPRSFFSADHHDNTRSGVAKGFTITQLWDLNDVSPLFRIPSSVIFGKKGVICKPLPKSGLEGISFSGNLPEHNCNYDKAKPKLNEEKAIWYYVKQGKSSAFSTKKIKKNNLTNPYKNLFKQGATIVPRNFYFVELTQEIPPDFEDRTINIKTSDDIKVDAKMPWKEINFEGRIESQFIFRTALSKNVIPFALINPELVVLPLTVSNKAGTKRIAIHKPDELRKEGHLQAAQWFQNAENIWNIHRTEKSKNMSSNDRLDFQRGVTEQNLNIEHLVLYSASAKDANATVVNRSDLDLTFIVESKTYWIACENPKEAYYLAAILNSKTPNERMKDFQTKGLFGARDVHKKILDIYYPRYNAKDESHTKLASLSEECHKKALKYLKKNPPKESLGAHHLGKIRIDIKKELKTEMSEIDKIVKKLIS